MTAARLEEVRFPNRGVRDANTWKVFMGITEENMSYARDFASMPATDAWVYACIRRLVTAAQSVPIRVYQYQSDGLDLEPVIGTGNPAGMALQRTLDFVNPVDMNWSDLIAYTYAGKKLWGGCYWKKVRGKFGGMPQELYFLRAPDTKPFSIDGRKVEYYDYSPKGSADEQILPKDIVRFADVNLENPLEFVSPLEAARNDIEVQVSAGRHTAATLRNYGIPAGAWVVPAGQEITQQDRSLIQRVLHSIKGPENAGKSAVLPAGLTWQNLAMKSLDAQWIEARRISRMTVCAVLGVPLVLAGDDDKLTTYASLRDARRIMWEDTVVPDLNWIANTINGWLVPDFDKTGQIRVAFDYSLSVALKDPLSVEKNIALSEIMNQVRTPNEYRSAFRIGKPLPDGDRVTPKTTVTLRPDPAADPVLLATMFPALNPDNKLEKPAQTVELFEPGGAEGDEADLPATLRSFGKALYKHPAVRAFTAFGGPLDAAALFGTTVPDETRLTVETGLKRRNSAAQIAASLGEH